VGGMPEIVKKYVTSDLLGITLHESIRAGQQDLIDAYYKDFAKHAGAVNAMHIAGVFENVPRQLAVNLDGSVKRYRFKDVLPNKRSYTELSGPIDWLTRAGLIIKTKIIEHIDTPLEAFCQNNLFKLYMFDVGLLGCMLGLDATSLLNDDYGIVKGYFSENFVATQLVAAGLGPLYAWNQANSEIEFLVPHAAQIFPLEVKSGTRTRAKSLAQYLYRYKPKKAFMLTANPIQIRDNRVVQNMTLYQAEWLKNFF
jgi:predicted AAA+ superfamily ATPase